MNSLITPRDIDNQKEQLDVSSTVGFNPHGKREFEVWVRHVRKMVNFLRAMLGQHIVFASGIIERVEAASQLSMFDMLAASLRRILIPVRSMGAEMS